MDDETLSLSSIKSDRGLWLTIFALLCAGAIMVYSSSFIFAQDRFHDGMFFFKRHLIFCAIGVAVFFVGWRIPVFHYRKVALPLLGVTIVLLIATLVPGLSYKAGGASRWIRFFGVGFQPSELAKFAVILFVATQLHRKIDRQTNWRSGFLTYFVGALPIYWLLLIQPDFGTTAICVCVTVAMLLSCGLKLRYLFTTIAMLAPAGTALILLSPYRRNRLAAFWDPWADPGHKGFQVIQSLIAFFNGKWFGVGLGNSREKLFYLPEAHNDFIFAVVGEELGLFGVVFFVTLFLVIVLRGLTVAQKIEAPFGRALAVGISTLLGFQAFFNMAVVLGLLPTKGLPLPLISYGGTSLVIMLFLLGVLTRLSEKLE